MTSPPRTSPSGPAVACALVLVLSVACCDAADLDVKCDSPLGCIPLWPAGHVPNETAGFPGPESRKGNDGEGCGVQHNTPCDHVYNVSVPTLTPFLVTNGTGAAVVIAPGGGYRDLAWGKEGLDVAHMYNALGVSAFVLKYRVPARPPVPGLPHWWAPLQDAQRAVGMVRAGAAKWNLDPNRIGFTGFSAGGHLTGHISTAWQERIYPRVDAADDQSCRPDFSLFMYPWMLLPDNKVPAWGEAYALAPEFDNITADHPISFFCQNEDDPTAPVQGTLAYYQKVLAEKGLHAPQSSLHVYPKGGHGFALCQGFDAFQEVCDWPQAAKRFLQDHNLTTGWPAAPASL